MGTWGVRPFENDNAQDWLDEELANKGAQHVLTRAIGSVAESEPDEYVDAPSGEIAFAAAEIVAAINGYPANDLPWQAYAYLGRTGERAQDQQTQLALVAVNRLLAANSELADLFGDSSTGTEAEWRASAEDLRLRLASPVRARPRRPLAARWRSMRTEAVERVLRRLLMRRGSS